jgi:putative hydrolase of HD superfamily
LDQVVEFWKLALRLKDEPRRGWAQRLHIQKIESVADHSFAVAILSFFEAERRGYDTFRVLQMALIHDLEEAITGDLTPKDKRAMDPKILTRRREGANRQVLAKLPPKMARQYRGVLREFKNGRTREARLVKDLDKFEMALQAWSYETRGTSRVELNGFYRSARAGIKDANLKKTLNRILE